MSLTKSKLIDILTEMAEEADYDLEYMKAKFGLDQKPLCKAKTKLEKPCTYNAVEGKNGYCTLHFNKNVETTVVAKPAKKPGKPAKAAEAVKDSDEEEEAPKPKKSQPKAQGREIKPKPRAKAAKPKEEESAAESAEDSAVDSGEVAPKTLHFTSGDDNDDGVE